MHVRSEISTVSIYPMGFLPRFSAGVSLGSSNRSEDEIRSRDFERLTGRNGYNALTEIGLEATFRCHLSNVASYVHVLDTIGSGPERLL